MIRYTFIEDMHTVHMQRQQFWFCEACNASKLITSANISTIYQFFECSSIENRSNISWACHSPATNKFDGISCTRTYIVEVQQFAVGSTSVRAILDGVLVLIHVSTN